MPQLRAPGVDRLTLPSDPEAWVEMKTFATFGDKTAAQEAMVNVTAMQPGMPSARNGRKGKKGQMVLSGGGQQFLTEYEVSAYFMALLERVIVNWNFTDEHGNALPITREHLEMLDAVDGEFLHDEAERRLGGRPADQQGPSKTPSSLLSPAVAASPKNAT